MVDPEEIQKVLDNDSFMELVELVKDAVIRKTMHQNTTDEEAADHRRDYRAIGRIMTALENAASAEQNQEENDNG